jgi:hypothetical protein
MDDARPLWQASFLFPAGCVSGNPTWKRVDSRDRLHSGSSAVDKQE